MESTSPAGSAALQAFLAYARGTPHRTFVLYPLAIGVGKLLLTRGRPRFA